MSKPFASIELARLYETQGYLEDALTMYKALDHDILKGGSGIRAAIKRIELALLQQEPFTGAEGDTDSGPADPAALIASSLAELNPEEMGAVPEPPVSPEETRVSGEMRLAGLMEKWLALMVVRKRLQLFTRIRSRL